MDQTITTKKTANGETKKRSGRAADDTPDANSPVELQNLLQSLRAMRSGDFTVRMGVEQDGILGKIDPIRGKAHCCASLAEYLLAAKDERRIAFRLGAKGQKRFGGVNCARAAC